MAPVLFSGLCRVPRSWSVCCGLVCAGSHDVGGTDADLIVDTCLIDNKSTKNPRLDKWWLYQLLVLVCGAKCIKCDVSIHI